jgi:two-component system, OmpR family, KDP operon response regulator KdpE
VSGPIGSPHLVSEMNSTLVIPRRRNLARIAKPNRKILVVDEDNSTRRLLRRVLEGDQYSILWSRDGMDALNQAVENRPDVIILELDLPHGNGFHVLKGLRKWNTARVIVLSWRSGVADKVRALDAGAYDYMVKPFDPDELAARVRAVLRCEPLTGEDPLPLDGSLNINMATREMAFDGVHLELSAKEKAVLFILARHAGKLVPQKRLIHAVWGPGAAWKACDINIQITNLRRKLRVHSDKELIQGGASFGYRMALTVFYDEHLAPTTDPTATPTKVPSKAAALLTPTDPCTNNLDETTPFKRVPGVEFVIRENDREHLAMNAVQLR